MSIIEVLRNESIMLATVCGLIGLIVGSFLNVVIHRLPKMLDSDWDNQAADLLEHRNLSEVAKKLRPKRTVRYNLMTPASSCPHCGHKIRAYENIPVASYVFLRGRCRSCKAPISIRYPVVEILSGVMAAYIGWKFGLTLSMAGALVFSWALLALTAIDIDTQLLPDDITLPLMWAGLLLNLSNVFAPITSAVLGAVAGYLSLWLVYWLFKLTTGKEGMGYGDFKLLAALGAWLGWQMVLPIVLGASLIGAAIGIAMKLGGQLREGRYVPFGP